MPQWPKHLQSPLLPVAFLLLLHKYCGIVWYETTATCATVRMSAISSKWKDFCSECIYTAKINVLFSKVVSYYNCMTILTMQFYECGDEKIWCGGSWYLNKLYSPPTKFFTSARFFELV